MAGPVICQGRLPIKPWMTIDADRLPGLSPVSIQDWLMQDDAYAAQMAYRDDLIRTKTVDVHACLPEAEAGARELLDLLMAELPAPEKRPDGTMIDIDTKPPLMIAGRLAQEDFALLIRDGDIHRLAGGIICFPAHWRLAEKLGKSVLDLHSPVAAFDPSMARRTEQILTHLRCDQPLQRANVLIYTNPDLHQPVSETHNKALTPGLPRYVRVERQTLRRLPRTDAIVFAIHTFVFPAMKLAPEDLARLGQIRPGVLDQ